MLAKMMEKLNIKSPGVAKGLLLVAGVVLTVLAVVYISGQLRGGGVVIEFDADAHAYVPQGPEDAVPVYVPRRVIVVYVSGEVRNAGVFEFYEGDRVVNAIEAAGGFTDYADPNAINLAAVLVDEQHIVVFSLEDGMPHTATAVAGQDGPAGDGRININTATAEELQALGGIGPALSERIVSHRNARGGFENIEEIMNVSGIGDRIFESIRDMIRVE
ncbi:MAG: helix-hairpin-helix domain-containing protein [Defluviitaleaceae bacterium]|nr:helix-hairpin-helix domain-containing protein [Defluviitaleaceae bacterium]